MSSARLRMILSMALIVAAWILPLTLAGPGHQCRSRQERRQGGDLRHDRATGDEPDRKGLRSQIRHQNRILARRRDQSDRSRVDRMAFGQARIRYRDRRPRAAAFGKADNVYAKFAPPSAANFPAKFKDKDGQLVGLAHYPGRYSLQHRVG